MNEHAKEELVQQGSTWFLRLAVLTIGAIVLALCVFALPSIWTGAQKEFPGSHETTNAMRGIMVIMYVAAVPFFVAIFQTMRLLSYIDKNKAFSELTVTALKTIKYCGAAISVAFVFSLPLFYIWADYDDAPGLVIVGMILVMAPLGVAVLVAVMQRLLRQAIKMKSENELTV